MLSPKPCRDDERLRSRSGWRRRGGRTCSALVFAEIALSGVLLMGASLTVRGFLKLQNMNAGSRPDGVLVVGLPMSPTRYASYDQRVAFSERVLEAMNSVPEVQSAAIGNGGLPFGGLQSSYSIGGQPKDESTGSDVRAAQRVELLVVQVCDLPISRAARTTTRGRPSARGGDADGAPITLYGRNRHR